MRFYLYFQGIIAKQFRDLKFGDRFQFETSKKMLRFTKEQLDSIRSVTMSRILCNNVHIDFLQKQAFYVANPEWNPLVSCDDPPELDLSLWQEEMARLVG